MQSQSELDQFPRWFGSIKDLNGWVFKTRQTETDPRFVYGFFLLYSYKFQETTANLADPSPIFKVVLPKRDPYHSVLFMGSNTNYDTVEILYISYLILKSKEAPLTLLR